MPKLTPAERDALLAPSIHFKKEATRAIFAILGFIIVYFLLFALSLGLVALSFYGGVAIIMAKPSFITLVVGLGMIGCGLMVFVFLVKFIFSSNKVDNSGNIEITKEDEPLFFQTIYELADACGTAKPRKIYLSGDVNASVSYNSSFWSMFIPIKKNLTIGLGLVNSVNVSELKAVISHEFGHFSQRSMKVGSWVFQVNKIIHDMLFNNTGYAQSLDSIASVHGIIAIFVAITIQVVKFIQWILHQMYKLVNKSYMGLSRQMEFHADLVAASVCGSNNIIHALKRTEFAQACFESTLETCNYALKEKKVINDFYGNHRSVIKHIARLNNVSLINELPLIKEDEAHQVHSRVNYKDQWASHPTLNERQQYLEPFGLDADVNENSAWTLFVNEDRWKKEHTEMFYTSVPSEEIAGRIDYREFESLYEKNLNDFRLPVLFGDFYNGRVISVFDPETVAVRPFTLPTFESIFSEEVKLLPKKIQFLEQDIAIVKAIINKEVDTISFDFDGKKYKRKDADNILVQLEDEIKRDREELAKLDQELFRFFYANLPLADAEKLKQSYIYFFRQRGKADAFIEGINNMMELLSPVFRGETLSLDTINNMIHSLKTKYEPWFKLELSNWMETGAFNDEPAVKESIEKFVAANHTYFSGNSFFDNELIELNTIVQDSWNGVSRYVFRLFRDIADSQVKVWQVKPVEQF